MAAFFVRAMRDLPAANQSSVFKERLNHSARARRASAGGSGFSD
tara:strand:- start:1331 stop:1462 length:132 start_codon:yes stop_codon:yes gene_type:complete